MMRKILMLMVVIGAAIGAAAQSPRTADRSQWMNELKQYKRAYFSRELGLSREQEQQFFPLYEQMEDETRQIEEETRAMERRVAEAEDATDLEYSKAAEALFDSKVKQAEVERGYMDKYIPILTKKQLFLLKSVERQFSRDLVKQHHRLRQGKRNAD